ncbi:polyketide synthase dehydratase domain-containing protein, partial [Kitasatospora sp. NPDC008050]|uniref:polyketide synthase dehydratase domain-containing protein n=1 Tax=Kitasatospora sp. NPDC008050 TaxID=3364021 RepID=UPI0036E4811C
NGIPITWTNHHPTTPTPLPTYPFQHQHYWLQPQQDAGDLTRAGLASPDHPLLGASITLADSDGWLFTSRISLPTHPWLADHAVNGTALLPGTAFLELAFHAGKTLDSERVEEIVLELPLLLPAQGGVQIQLAVAAPDALGRRQFTVHSRPENSATSAEAWTRHASGVLTPGRPAAGFDLTQWPPTGAESLAVHDLYDNLAGAGFAYGPAFQGVQAVWKLGDEVYAEIGLPEDQRSEANRFGLHPALADAALHIAAFATSGAESGRGRLPFSWSGVSLHADGASFLRVKLTPTGPQAYSLAFADAAGQPVASIDALTVRELSPEDLDGTDRDVLRECLHRLSWTALTAREDAEPAGRWALVGSPSPRTEALLGSPGRAAEVFADLSALTQAVEAGSPLPDFVLLPLTDDAGSGPGSASGSGSGSGSGSDDTDVVARVHAATERALHLLQSWLRDERLIGAQLIVLTENAVVTEQSTDVPDLVQAALWGLVSSAQSENPGLITLLDTDAQQVAAALLGTALDSGEPRIAFRSGEARVPRLVKMKPAEVIAERIDGSDEPLDRSGTALITGATGMLGSLIARHLVHHHGI